MEFVLYDSLKPFLLKNTLLVLPASLATVHYVQTTLGHNSFALLYLYQDYAKLVCIEDGVYKGVFSINLGKRKLVAMIQEA
jgi:hypothetical protein